MSHNFRGVFEDFITLFFEMNVGVALITGSEFLHRSYVICEVFSYILYLLLKVLSHIAKLLLEPLDNSFFIKFIFIFKFSD